jgi:hypothetical protein
MQKKIVKIVARSSKCFVYSHGVLNKLHELGFSGYETEEMGRPTKVYVNFNTRQICSAITQGADTTEYPNFEEFVVEWEKFLEKARRRRIYKIKKDIRNNLRWLEKAEKELAELEAATPAGMNNLALGVAEVSS